MCDLLKERFAKWQDWWAKDDDVNSVRNQVYNMMRNAAVFESMRMAWEMAWQREEDRHKLNWSAATLISCAFVESQVAAIARLLDGRSDVISLKRLVKDIELHKTCLTRQNILDVHKLQYEYKYAVSNPNDPEWKNCCRSKSTHDTIDQLANITDPSERKPTDRIRASLLEWLDKRLDMVDLKKIAQYRHKFVAHAATENSRIKIWGNTDLQLSFREICNAQETICKTAFFVAEKILGNGIAKSPLHDISADRDKPLVMQQDIDAGSEKWKEYEKNMAEWTKWDWKNDFERK